MAKASATPTRSSGVLLHVTSLPGPFGVGDLGPAAREWIDLLADAKQAWWQMLPLVPPGSEHSPYESYSAFAGNPLLISPEDLVGDGLLRASDLPAPLRSTSQTDYARAQRIKHGVLGKAAEQFFAGRKLRDAYERFCTEHRDWLDDYALFVALRATHNHRHWTHWSPSLVCRDAEALRDARKSLGQLIDREKFVQFIFDRQVQRLRDHARRRNLQIIGDLPIFVSYEACDVWAHPHLFQLDRNRRPTAVAGVPPDMFSATGQRWGNPLYNYDAMKKDRFAWWTRRLKRTLQQCDLVRLDHFRGLESYWRIPASSPDARKGKWTKAPGQEMLTIFLDAVGALPLIAEDLGVITPPVEELRDGFELPGMRVLQFGFDGNPNNPHLPHNYVPNCIAYSGTHDNDTSLGWYRSADNSTRQNLHKYVGRSLRPTNVPHELMRQAWSSVAKIAIAPLQDVLALPTSARMNMPGTHKGNWRWRLKRLDDAIEALKVLAQLTDTYGRARADKR